MKAKMYTVLVSLLLNTDLFTTVLMYKNCIKRTISYSAKVQRGWRQMRQFNFNIVICENKTEFQFSTCKTEGNCHVLSIHRFRLSIYLHLYFLHELYLFCDQDYINKPPRTGLYTLCVGNWLYYLNRCVENYLHMLSEYSRKQTDIGSVKIEMTIKKACKPV